MSVLREGIIRALQHVFVINNLSDLVATERQEMLLGKPIVYYGVEFSPDCKVTVIGLEQDQPKLESDGGFALDPQDLWDKIHPLRRVEIVPKKR